MVGKAGPDQRLDPGIDVALRDPALTDARFQIGAHAHARTGEGYGIEAVAAGDVVGAIACVDEVIARAGIDPVVAAAADDRIVTRARSNEIVPGATVDPLGQVVADNVIGLTGAIELAGICRRHGRHREAGVFGTLAVGDAVFDRNLAGETGGKAHDDKLLTGPGDDFGNPCGDAAALRQFDHIEHRIHAHEARQHAPGVVEIDVPDAVAIGIHGFDVEIVGEQVADPQHQRHVERRDEAFVLADRGVVVRRNDDDIDEAFGGPLGVVGDAIDEPARDARVGVGGEQQIAVGVEFEDAVDRDHRLGPELEEIGELRIAPPGELQRIKIDVAVVAEQGRDRDDRGDIFVDENLVAARDRRSIADVVEIQPDHRAIDRAFGVDHRIAEAGFAPVIGIGGEDDRAVIGQLERPVRCAASVFEPDCKALGIAVVLEQFADRDFDRGVFETVKEFQAARAIVVIACIGTVVDRLIDDCRPRPTTSALAIVDLVIEPRLAVEIGARLEQHGPVGQQPCGAAERVARRYHGHRVAVVLDVVGEQLLDVDHDRVVFEDRPARLGKGETIVVRLRSVVDRGHGKADPSRRGCAVAVGHDIVEPRRAPVIVARGNVDQPIGADAGDDVDA